MPMNDFWNESPGPPLPAEAEEFLSLTILILGGIFLAITLLIELIRWLVQRRR